MGGKNIFVCPACPSLGVALQRYSLRTRWSNSTDDLLSQDGNYFMAWGLKEGTPASVDTTSVTTSSDQRKTFWCYIKNSKLDDTIKPITQDQVPNMAVTPYFVEKIVNVAEAASLANPAGSAGPATAASTGVAWRSRYAGLSRTAT